MSTLDDIYKLTNEMGLVVESLNLDGQWHRVQIVGKPKSNKSGAYCLSEFSLNNGKTAVVGMLSNHSKQWEESITLEGVEGVTAEELAEAKRKSREAAELSKREKIKLQAETALRAQTLWDSLPDSGQSQYLKKKRVGAYGIKFTRGSIVVPARDIDGKLWTLQFTKPDGSKRFLTGGAKRARFHLIKKESEATHCLVVGIAEGYATAVSIYNALSRSVSLAVAFDAGNILPVGEAFRSRYPDARIIFFADHDVHKGYPQAFIKRCECTPAVRVQIDRLARVRPDVAVEVVKDNDPRLRDRDKHYNTGVTKCLLAAAAVDGDVVIPRFNNTNNNKEATA